MYTINYFDKYLNLIDYSNNNVIEVKNEITKKNHGD